MVAVAALASIGCLTPPVESQSPPVHVSCASTAWAASPTDEGDTALCQRPNVVCDPANEVLAVVNCHFPPSASPTQACCDARPMACPPNDCDCLLYQGPWIDADLARDAGLPWPDTNSGKRVCSYRVSCSPGVDGGAAVLLCNPA